ncbi:MAG: LacI family transcriptional regulator [Firmicutes bacterium]|nr:LacI family transcriptional regulator [Bacillota bacterium]
MATIKDVAKRSGLGLATVSKYINGGNVKEENKLAIENAINEVGFEVNEIARGLRTKRSRTIGVVIPELNNFFITTILSYINDILRSRGYSMIVSDCRSNTEFENHAINVMLSKQVDGIINMPVSSNEAHLIPAIESKIPIVLIDRLVNGFMDETNAVLVNNVKASVSATNLLIEAGHRDIGIILGPNDVFTATTRLKGFKQALDESNIPFQDRLVEYGNYTTQGGYESTIRLIENEKPTALFVTNYDMMIGSVLALNDMGLTIPKDISFVGFDNWELATVVKPKLTVVAQPLEEIAHTAAEILLNALDTGDMGTTIKTLTTHIQPGESVAKYRK